MGSRVSRLPTASIKPPIITIREVLSSKPHRKWNYARFTDFRGKEHRLEPCCLKSDPC